MKNPAKLVARVEKWSPHAPAGRLMRDLAEALQRKEDDAFYGGMLAALAVVAVHDAETIYREIVGTLGRDGARELRRVARIDGCTLVSGLVRYGYARGPK